MSTVPSKNLFAPVELTARSITRKQSSDMLENRSPEILESTDPAAAVRRLAQQMVGQRLPSERILAARLNISRPYLRSILALLQKEGIVEARAKSGTYVVDDRAPRLHRIVLLIDADLKLNDDPFILSLVDGIQRSIQGIGARCLIERSDGREYRPPLEDGVLTLGLAGKALIAGQRPDDPPMVGLLLDAESRPNRRASVFQLDDQDAGRTAARLLLAQGCRDVIFLGRQDIPASRERSIGVKEVCDESGMLFRFLDCHLNYAAGLGTGRSIDLSDAKDPVGIVATNDWLALGLRMGLRHRDTSARHDVHIASFDGLTVTADPMLGIQSLAIPISEIAADAVAELQRLHQSPAAAGRVVRYSLR